MSERSWSIHYDVREDAINVFVPADELDGAEVGDLVELISSSPPTVRHGRVANVVDDAERGRHAVISFEAPDPAVDVERATE